MLTQASVSQPKADSDGAFGGYIHVPWCKRQCPYCDFYFEVGTPSEAFQAGIDAELQSRSSEYAGQKLTSLYFGGGTPTALAPQSLHEIIQLMEQRIGLLPNAEITVEANPEDIGEGVVAELATYGVNRLSLGIQSFDDATLRFLGRGHNSETALRALVEAKAVRDVSIDLIIGLPQDTAKRIRSDIDMIARNEIAHISVYLLTIEPKTPMWNQIRAGRRADVDADRQADLYAYMQETLRDAGYTQYEISSFALPKKQSTHNRLYWSQGTYVGLGPAAHSMRLKEDGSVIRRANIRSVKKWLEDPTGPIYELETLSPHQALREAMAFGLRDLERGIHLDTLEKRHQLKVSKDQMAALHGCVDKGWLKGGPRHYTLTASGALFADAVARALL